MLANYGYTDGSGSYYITVDTDQCNGCGDCATACPQHLFEIITDDYDEKKAAVKEDLRKNIKYLCGPCKPTSGWKTLPCLEACTPDALKHSW